MRRSRGLGSTATIPERTLAFLVDTNVLLRLVASADPLHVAAIASIHALEEDSEELYASGQNFIEL